MDSYLDIARIVLRARRRPMGAKAILAAARVADILPDHLYGKTQQKTLQARLSEDILHNRESSIFYRTMPGQFALKEFLTDPEFPSKWKVEFPARRRTRDLKRPDSLAVPRAVVNTIKNTIISMSEFSELLGDFEAVVAMHPDEMAEREYCAVWTFSIVQRVNEVLAYRIGRYRDDRDTFANRRSIGFPGTLAVEDASLFSTDSLGILDCAVSVLQQDLDLSMATFEQSEEYLPKVEYVTALPDLDNRLDVVIVALWECPDWFEPTTKRLSFNDPLWLSTGVLPNNIDDFEPWSARVLGWLVDKNRAELVQDPDQ